MADRAHTAVRMEGRDPHEAGRASTPLELLFDLTFVIAFGTASNELAHFITHDHVREGLIGFGFATFAISWAWINFSWFASAYDTDDWIFRLTTMVQMVGVLVLALGLSDMFESLKAGDHVDNQVMVLGYVVMRVPMLLQWKRAERQDTARRGVGQTMFATVLVAQIGWIVLLLLDLRAGPMFVGAFLLGLVELAGPVLAESRGGGTPWHPHHIAERYGLLVIIALGEGLLGTMASLTAIVGVRGPGWSVDVAVLGLAGTAMTFGMWWSYFTVPSGPLLHAHRERSFGWGYGHIPFFGATVAVGAGLHAAAYYLNHQSHLGLVATVLAVAIPLGLYVVTLYLLYAQISHTMDPFHLLLVAASVAVLAASVGMGAAGVSMPWCLLMLAFTPWVTVLGYELAGHRHQEAVLAEATGGA
ncbi:low temperature requirement protein A [Nocardioides sp.]|uniref:low temperature requirement protein A n=1 Tax=Nocardioides sp. TaxID=35761 RepID=UPI0031FF0CA9|nr:rane protein [Nocardioides sp.]